MRSKYELTKETMTIASPEGDITLYRIKALKDVGVVTTGTLGGWVETESNLRQEGECWVCRDAIVSDGAMVFGNAIVSGKAEVSGDARVFGHAKVLDDAMVFRHAKVAGNAIVSGGVYL